MFKLSTIALCVALSVTSTAALAAHVVHQVGAYNVNTAPKGYVTVVKTIPAQFCVSRTPKDKSTGSAYPLPCFNTSGKAYRYYLDHSGANADDPNSTTYVEDFSGNVLWAQ